MRGSCYHKVFDVSMWAASTPSSRERNSRSEVERKETIVALIKLFRAQRNYKCE
jgi:hypothetical protein